jgi:hypothetical protein
VGFWRAAALAACLLGAAGPANAQTTPRETVTDERVWLVVALQSRADRPGPWRWSFENILRSRDGVSTIDIAGLRPILNYTIDKHSTVGGGYAYVVNLPETIALVEQRIFQQYIWTNKFGAGTFSVRERLEERFLDGNSGVAVRLRQQFRYSHPIKPGSRFSVIGYDELFVHFNETTAYKQGVDQNRLFGGIGDTINKTVRFELGYLNQYSPTHGVAAPRMNHVLSGSFAISF